MEAVDDLESMPPTAVTFQVEKDKEVQEVRELILPEALPGFSGGKMSGKSLVEGGNEKKEA